MNTDLEYSTRVVQEGGRRCKKSTLNDLTPDPSKNTFNEPAKIADLLYQENCDLIVFNSNKLQVKFKIINLLS